MFIRIHSEEIGYKTASPIGIFVTIWKLVDSNTMTESEIEAYWINRRYFETALPVPPFYSDQNSIKAITYFKNNSKSDKILSEMRFYFNIAKKYNIQLFKTTVDEVPGTLIYEDDYQIGVIPDPQKKFTFIVEPFN